MTYEKHSVCTCNGGISKLSSALRGTTKVKNPLENTWGSGMSLFSMHPNTCMSMILLLENTGRETKLMQLPKKEYGKAEEGLPEFMYQFWETSII